MQKKRENYVILSSCFCCDILDTTNYFIISLHFSDSILTSSM
jgi:hypothetical protein